VRTWGLLFALAGCGYTHGTVPDSPSDSGPIDGDGGDEGSDASDGGGDTSDALTALCPIGYDVAIGTSRYRIINTNAVFRVQHDACRTDTPGTPHLVALDSVAEMNALMPILLMQNPQADLGSYFVGGVQMTNQATPAAGWLLITGEPLPAGLWDIPSAQPDDQGGAAGEDNYQNIAALHSADTLHDHIGSTPSGAVCECDGKAIDPTAAALIP
jgi:hypothetical protein